MSGEYPRGKVEFFEDFLLDNGDGTSSYGGMTETIVDACTQDLTDKHGGWWRQTTSDDTDAALLASERCWEVDEGHPLIFETRLVVDDASSAVIAVGFHDNVAASGAILWEDEGGTLESAPTDGFGFMVEGGQDETWQAVATDSDTDKTQVALTLGADCADAVVQTLRMEANPNDSGTVKYFIDGELVSTRTAWFDSGIVFNVGLSCDWRTGAINVDYDYIYVMAPRS